MESFTRGLQKNNSRIILGDMKKNNTTETGDNSFPREYFVKMGKKGGKKTKKLYGLTHFSRIGKKKTTPLSEGTQESIL